MTLSYFTILILSYYVPDRGELEHIQTKYVLTSMSDCDRLIRTALEPLRVIYPDASAFCVETGLVSAQLLRPRSRPDL